MNPGTKSTYEESLSNVLERTLNSLNTLNTQSNIQKQLIQPSYLERVEWETLISSIERVLTAKA